LISTLAFVLISKKISLQQCVAIDSDLHKEQGVLHFSGLNTTNHSLFCERFAAAAISRMPRGAVHVFYNQSGQLCLLSK
jgi:hypothetical protein